MIKSRYMIEIGGEKVEMLFSLALFGIAKRRGIKLELPEDADVTDRLQYFIELMYCAAILAWDYKSFDHPDMGDFPYQLLDFGEWSSNHPMKFAEIVKGASQAIAGREQDGSAEDVKKK